MNVLMLGWEYPPHISGGLGTACLGLTTSLARLGVSIRFVVPHLFGDESAPHMRLVDAGRAEADDGSPSGSGGGATVTTKEIRIPSPLSPYLSEKEYARAVWARELSGFDDSPADPTRPPAPSRHPIAPRHYGRDLMAEVQRYADEVVQLAPRDVDVVHAHDWMTFPAGIAVATLARRPLVLHVHSLEHDRSGGGGNAAVIEIERTGFRRADRIIAVSHYTKGLITRLHRVPEDKIEVVHNGVYSSPTVAAYRRGSEGSGPIVLFLGRVTLQKGPEYFVEAARIVRKEIPDARFIMAGSGDLLPQVYAQVEALGLSSCFEFPGFVTGAEVERLFSIADVYVMPSVSEPFGISALEAMSHDTPVILSRQSGVSEVLRHALKVDFWDTDQLGRKIVAMLRYPELRESITAMAREEVRNLHWDAAAQKSLSVYRSVLTHFRAVSP